MKFYLPGLLVFFLVSALAGQSGKQTMDAGYARRPIRIDGRLNDWPRNIARTFPVGTRGAGYNNTAAVSLAWDEHSLYGYFRVTDHFLVGLEPAEAKQRLMYNDGVEFYIDSHNDSRDTMDLNDYQFSMDINGNSAVFRGDRLDRFLKFRVPKEEGVANIVFRSAVRCMGSVNRMEDRDSMYLVEFAVEWASIGVRPVPGMEFKADLCVNDNDTLADFRLLPEGPVRLLNFGSIGGSVDFGFPNQWIGIRLGGSAPERGRLTELLLWDGLLIFVAACAVVAFIVLRLRLQRRRSKEAGSRNPAAAIAPARPVNTRQPASDGQPDQPVIVQAREYITLHISEALRPEQLAGGLGVSLRNLERIFKRALNTTPNAFIMVIRLEYAAGLLSGGNHNIAEVADAAGFNDPAYFSRVFKKHFGQTPREFHSNHKSGRS